MSEEALAMEAAIADARALLGTFLANDWADVHVSTGDVEIFIAREIRRLNPMRSMLPSPLAGAEAATQATTIDAPHVATVVELVEIGMRVDVGGLLARLRVLDVETDIMAPSAGIVAAQLVALETLVEFGTPLVKLVPV